MKTGVLLQILSLGLLLGTVMCKHQEASEVRVYGGELVPAGQLTSAVQIGPRCGAVKIAARAYLTAGHCLASVGAFGGGINLPPPGSPVQIRIGNGPDRTLFQTTLVSAQLFPPYHQTLQDLGLAAITQPSSANASDLAVLQIEEELTEIVIAPVDFEPVTEATEVVYSGFGSEEISGGSTDQSPFKSFETTIDAVEGNYLLIKADIAEINATGTAGRGDSGAPLYKKGSDLTNPAVVGINSFRGSIQIDGNNGIQIGLSRIDADAQGDPKAWVSTFLPSAPQ